jgi:hypothetical protein
MGGARGLVVRLGLWVGGVVRWRVVGAVGGCVWVGGGFGGILGDALGGVGGGVPGAGVGGVVGARGVVVGVGLGVGVFGACCDSEELCGGLSADFCRGLGALVGGDSFECGDECGACACDLDSCLEFGECFEGLDGSCDGL